MNKKFLSAILFGALMVTSTGTFVSCKDYDDDIDSINKELTDIKSQVAALQNKVDAGKYVTNVAKSGENVVVTWSDGASSTIGTLKGDKGDAVAVTIDPTTKNWLIDGVDTGVCAEGKQGDAAATPIFSLGTDGHIYVQYGAEAEKEDLGVSTGGIYVVENGPKVTLHVPNAEGEYQDIVLPKTAAISEIKAVTIRNSYRGASVDGNQYYYTAENVMSDGAQVTLYYGQAKAAGKYFDGTEFAKGEILTSAQSVNKLSAQVNPTMADASVYEFYLTDSKGNSYLELSNVAPNKTVGPLTRAEATVNKGIYDMSLSFAEGITMNQIKSLYKNWAVTDDNGDATDAYSAGNYVALAIGTKDAYGNEVLSGYDVKVNASTGRSYIWQEKTAEVEVGKTLDLASVLYMHNIIDVKYSISKAQTATKDAMGVVLEGGKISAEKTGSIKVTVDWMNCEGVKTTDDGVSGEFDITVKFVSTKNTGALEVEWTVAKADGKANVKTLNVNEYTKNQQANDEFKYAANTITYINADGKKVAAPAGAIVPSFSSVDADANGVTDGYWTRTLKYTFDPAKVIPTTYTHEIPYGDNDKLTVTIVVKEPASYFNFQVLDAYFNADKTEAVAYGTPNGSTIDYNLFKLFNNATVEAKANITFSEVVPEKIKNADDKWAYAAAWLTGSKVVDANKVAWTSSDAITVDKVNGPKDVFFGGAYSARTITAKYQPYGNANLTPAKMTFDLTIKSEIFEGTIEYVKAVKNDKGVQTGWTAGDIKEVDGGKNATLALTEILANDVYGKAYNNAMKSVSMLDETRVADVKVVLADDNAKEYLKLSADNFANGAITISKKSENTAIVTPPTCTVQVKVTDKWNKVKTLDIQVKVIK